MKCGQAHLWLPPANRKPFGALMSDTILPLDLTFEKTQCFSLSHLKDSALSQFRQHYSGDSITKILSTLELTHCDAA